MSGAAPHLLTIRVYYEDTDAGGIVYHAAYLRFAERARTEMLRAAGLDHTGLRATHGIVFAVRRCTVEFLAPARLDDLLAVETIPLRVSGARMLLAQTVMLDGRPLARLEIELAVLGSDLRPRRLPPVLRGRFPGPGDAGSAGVEGTATLPA